MAAHMTKYEESGHIGCRGLDGWRVAAHRCVDCRALVALGSALGARQRDSALDYCRIVLWYK